MSIGDLPESSSRAMLVGIMLVGRLGVARNPGWPYPWSPRPRETVRGRAYEINTPRKGANGVDTSGVTAICLCFLTELLVGTPANSVFPYMPGHTFFQ